MSLKTSKITNPNFVLVVVGQIISLFGNGILRFALPLYLLQVAYMPRKYSNEKTKMLRRF